MLRPPGATEAVDLPPPTMDRDAMPAEIELKFALSPDAHVALGRRLGQEWGPGSLLRQANRFFDSRDHRLRAQRVNLRLRTENDRLVVTAKRKVAATVDFQHHDEWEVVLPAWDGDPATLPRPDWIAAALGDAQLVDLGGFANLRQEWHRDGEVVCLDRTDFATRIDHELEVEVADAASALPRWQARLADWGIAHAPQPVTKFARWLNLQGG